MFVALCVYTAVQGLWLLITLSENLFGVFLSGLCVCVFDDRANGNQLPDRPRKTHT
jgi:hypothetical protein